MPPQEIATICQPAPANVTVASGKSDIDDRNALLYIVVTLLFYSMGIVIGIITYLKREQAEMEEDKMFEVYLHMKREPFNLHKQERVNQMALYLKQLEERKVEMEKANRWDGSGSDQQLHHPLCPHQQLQLQREQHPDAPQLYPETQKLAALLPCSICHAGANFGDFHGPSHLDPHHLQPLISRSRHSSGKETPAGTPALLCSLTLNVCEPFLSPETLPKAALPFRPPTPRDGGQNNSFQNCCQTMMKKGDSPDPSAFKDDNISAAKALETNSDPEQAMCQMSEEDSEHQGLCSSEKLLRHFNSTDRNETHNNEGETMVELQPLGLQTTCNEGTNHNVFQAPCVQSLSPEENPECSQCDKIDDHNIQHPFSIYKPSLMLATSSPSPPLYSRALSSDEVSTSCNRNKLKRQLSLHNERSPLSTNRPTYHPRLQTEEIEEEDSRIPRCSESDSSAVCETAESNKSSTERETPKCSIDTDSAEQVDVSKEHFDQPLISPPLKLHERVPLGGISISHSDPVLPQKSLLSPAMPKPRDARPKIYSMLEKSDNGSLGEGNPANTLTTSPDQGRGRLRRTILEAWRENSPQSVDIPEISKLHKTVPPNTSFPSFSKAKGQHSQPEVARSTFPRAPGPREERRGALFLSQKSLLHASGAPAKSTGEARVPQQHRVGSVHRSGLTYQLSVDQTLTSLNPLLDSSTVGHLQSSSDRDSSVEDSSGLAPLMSSQRDPRSRIPKLSRARTVDTSSLLDK
ncbi:hypothetical protein ElyMa_002471300 [Elysia marginata]|uniref:Potassium channel voltage dependent KCNQ C-terminal domain-containing protein n=1 Tax=Elysia marginata TaxID=1093978 RepID=A0AAV4GM63_9GAST|nr:hypothetical protein ElyMa_002471300 [Elysia marginata]